MAHVLVQVLASMSQVCHEHEDVHFHASQALPRDKSSWYLREAKRYCESMGKANVIQSNCYQQTVWNIEMNAIKSTE